MSMINLGSEDDYYSEYKQAAEEAVRLRDKVNLLTIALQECREAGERDVVAIVDKTFNAIKTIDESKERRYKSWLD